MELTRLIKALSDSSAYPETTQAIEVHQTHISVVFLTGQHAYKIKKPVNLGFLDFTTLEKREHFCHQEVQLNRRLAPSVYLGVVPVIDTGSRLVMESTGEALQPDTHQVVEWAVKMEQLPAEATLLSRLRRGQLQEPVLERLAAQLAHFHAGAGANPHIASFGTFEAVAKNARENFTQTQGHVEQTVSTRVFKQVRELTERELRRIQPIVEDRAHRGIPRDTHGDLHLDHVYYFPDRPEGQQLVIIDCIEFNDRFRYADPVADLAFLVMDLHFHGRADLARIVADTYFQITEDWQGRDLLPFYSAYRAVVRAKVEGMEATEAEVPEEEQQAARQRACAHWLLALGMLAPPRQRPCLLLLAGLPGTGKSTLGRHLAESVGSGASFTILQTDAIRKELADLGSGQGAEDSPGVAHRDIYTPEWTAKTYRECLHRVESLLKQGQRVLVDASFRDDGWRQKFLALGAAHAVPVALLHCWADDAIVKTRLDGRKNDISDADWNIYQLLSRSWEEPGPGTLPYLHSIDANGSPEHTADRARQVLRELGIIDPESPVHGGDTE